MSAYYNRPLWLPYAVVAGMMLWAPNPENPYAYYELLRWVSCGALVFLAVRAHQRGEDGWAWTLGITAAVFNPIAPLRLTRSIWSVLNLAAVAVVALAYPRIEQRR